MIKLEFSHNTDDDIYVDEYERNEVLESIIYVGTANEVRDLYDHLTEKCGHVTKYDDDPKFNPDRMYGLNIEYIDLDERELSAPVVNIIRAPMYNEDLKEKSDRVSWFQLQKMEETDKHRLMAIEIDEKDLLKKIDILKKTISREYDLRESFLSGKISKEDMENELVKIAADSFIRDGYKADIITESEISLEYACKENEHEEYEREEFYSEELEEDELSYEEILEDSVDLEKHEELAEEEPEISYEDILEEAEEKKREAPEKEEEKKEVSREDPEMYESIFEQGLTGGTAAAAVSLFGEFEVQPTRVSVTHSGEKRSFADVMASVNNLHNKERLDRISDMADDIPNSTNFTIKDEHGCDYIHVSKDVNGNVHITSADGCELDKNELREKCAGNPGHYYGQMLRHTQSCRDAKERNERDSSERVR